ncbi:transcriptional regulator [Echinicola pacifica]|uniref:Transcriptional regulator n=1 Tax=Echinicola pacifica TaxID=346377 RepID=A0A918UPR6_9BACT|nr:XRE family transcriptional regulator [Echinicola pacifica]GGZ25029.1 transcriptional regulator [Echinicola pacifica]
MEDYVLVQISNKIKNIRKSKNLTVQELADRAKVSKGLISQIENGRTIPSLIVLIQIIGSLEVDLMEFFSGLSLNDKGLNILVKRKEEYETFEKEPAEGYLYHRIFTKGFVNTTIDIVLLEIAPGSKREYVTTDAYEYKFMVSGEVKYDFKTHSVVLKEGDSLLFDGNIAHNPINETKKTAKMLVIYFFKDQK